jgi:hypothetical protein
MLDIGGFGTLNRPTADGFARHGHGTRIFHKSWNPRSIKMANLVITGLDFATAVQPKSIQLGEACAAFDVVYLSSGKYFKAAATDVAMAKAAYILTHAGGLDTYVSAVPLSGLMTITSTPTLVQGTQYCVSATAGAIAPVADLVSTNFITNVFMGVDATTGRMANDATGITVP